VFVLCSFAEYQGELASSNVSCLVYLLRLNVDDYDINIYCKVVNPAKSVKIFEVREKSFKITKFITHRSLLCAFIKSCTEYSMWPDEYQAE